MRAAFFSEVQRDRHKYTGVRLASYLVVLGMFVGNVFLNTAAASTTCRPLMMPPTTGHVVAYHLGSAPYWYYILASGQLGGTTGNDSLSLELISPAVGTFDLSTHPNHDYFDCVQCVMLRQHVGGGGTGKIFFQSSGELTLSIAPSVDDPFDPVPVVFNNLRLFEVTLEDDGRSTFVPDGECYVGVDDAIFIDGFDYHNSEGA